MRLWCAEGIEPPVRGRKSRFAVDTPEGMCSNSWAVSTSGRGDVYIMGRDNFRESKVSLHQSGRWRLAETDRAASESPDLVAPGRDRAAFKWDRPEAWGERAQAADLPPAAVKDGVAVTFGWSADGARMLMPLPSNLWQGPDGGVS
jgi:hypothetical protein